MHLSFERFYWTKICFICISLIRHLLSLTGMTLLSLVLAVLHIFSRYLLMCAKSASFKQNRVDL